MKAVIQPNGTIRLVEDSVPTGPDETRIFIDTEKPADTSTHVAEPSYEITPTTVTRIWQLRLKTSEEKRRIWNSLEFLSKFTSEERAAVRGAAPDLAEILLAAHEVNSEDQLTQYAFAQLVAAGIFTQERANQVLEIT